MARSTRTYNLQSLQELTPTELTAGIPQFQPSGVDPAFLWLTMLPRSRVVFFVESNSDVHAEYPGPSKRSSTC